MWPDDVHRILAQAGVRIVSYVPDAGHKRLIELCQADKRMRAVPLATEEDGVGITAGAWLGGEKSVLLMQSSGVGNIINALGMTSQCKFPLLMVVTMRGEQGEFNPWQVPMGQAVPGVLKAMAVEVVVASDAAAVAPLVKDNLQKAFDQQRAIAVLIAQRVIGIKSFQEQANQ